MRRDQFNALFAQGVTQRLAVVGLVADQPLRPFVKTVDESESLTGIDFLPALADDVEDRIEATDANNASADWHIDQDLIPSFPGTARAIHVKDCD